MFTIYMYYTPVIWILLTLIAYILWAYAARQTTTWTATHKFTFYHFIIFNLIITMIITLICIFWFHWHIIPGWSSSKSAHSKVFGGLKLTDPDFFMFYASHNKAVYHFITDALLLISLFSYKNRITWEEKKIIIEVTDNNQIDEETTQKKTKSVKILNLEPHTYRFLIRICLIHFISFATFLTDNYTVFMILAPILILILLNTIVNFGHVKNSDYGFNYKYGYFLISEEKRSYKYEATCNNWVYWLYHVLYLSVCVFTPMLGIWILCRRHKLPLYHPYQEYQMATAAAEHGGLLYDNSRLVAFIITAPFIACFFITTHWIQNIKYHKVVYVDVAFFMFLILQNLCFYCLNHYSITMIAYIYTYSPLTFFIFYTIVLLYIIWYKVHFSRLEPTWAKLSFYSFFIIVQLILTIYYFDSFFVPFWDMITDSEEIILS